MSKENILQASLNRLFGDAEHRNPSGSVFVRAHFFRVCERLGAHSTLEKLKAWEIRGYLKIIKDPSAIPDDETAIELFDYITEE